MKKLLGGIALAGGAAAMAVVLSATPAMAATTWTVTGGGNWTAGTGTASGNNTVLSDTTHPNTITCKPSGSTPASQAAGTLPNGTGLSSPLGTVTSLSFNNCSTVINGITIAATVTNSGFPWNINADSYSNGVTTGHISGVNSTVKISTFLGGCTINVTGDGTGKYTNSTGVLHMQQIGTTFTLTVNSATGSLCNGVTKGDTVTFDTPPDTGTLGGYLVTNGSGGHPQITSP